MQTAPAFAASRCVVAVLFSLVLCPFASSQQASNPPDPGLANNCSHRYWLRLSDDTAPRSCQESCLQSSPSMPGQENPVESCVSLWNILEMHHNISTGDCLELLFAPGSYRLPSLDQVRIPFSLVMSALDGEVVFTCGCEVEAAGGTLDSAGGITPALMEFEGQGSNMSVVIDGIVFRSCSRKLQFDEVNYVSIRNCSFM